MNTFAMLLGYAVMLGLLLAIGYFGLEAKFGRPAYIFTLFGFGPVWFDAEANQRLHRNLIKAGYRLRRHGRWAYGLSAPRWFSRIVRRAA